MEKIFAQFNIDAMVFGAIVASVILAFILVVVIFSVRYKSQYEKIADLRERLKEREEKIRKYKEWIDEVIKIIKERPEVEEVKLVGGVAEGRLESSHDVDLLVVIKEGEPKRVREELEKEIERRVGKVPVHLHVVRRASVKA